jgi:uncharacterized protein
LEHVVDTSMDLVPTSGLEEERRLPDRYDPLPLGARLIRPRDLIEDELLLALPQIPMHEPDVCAGRAPEADTAKTRSGIPSPFAVLAGLKRER